MPTKKTKKPTIDEIITKTIYATRIDCAQTPKDTYKATEKRLYAYPVIKEKVNYDKEILERYLSGEKPSKGNWFVRFQKSGVRLSDEDILDMLTQDIIAKIAANEYELETIDRAMEIISNDQYIKIIFCLYFQGMSIAETCDDAYCDRSTVFRQKSRLVQRLATFLYGTNAL